MSQSTQDALGRYAECYCAECHSAKKFLFILVHQNHIAVKVMKLLSSPGEWKDYFKFNIDDYLQMYKTFQLFTKLIYKNYHHMQSYLQIQELLKMPNLLRVGFIKTENGTARIRHQCRKTTVLSRHRCLINTGVEKMNYISI